MTTWLLVTDVDDTLIGDDDALGRFVAAVRDAPLQIVLNSSRPVASVRRSIDDLAVPLSPAGVIGALGTEIELRGAVPDGWARRFSGFDPEVIRRALAPFGATPHSDEYQRPHKQSFAIDAERWAEAEAALEDVQPPVKVITSGESSFDVIPAQAGKGEALRFVAAALSIPMDRVLAAGDSENDVDALRVASAILVGNATPGLRQALADPGRTLPAFQAESDRADGLLEGLAHYGVPLARRAAPMREEPA